MRRASSNGGLDGRTRRAAPAGARRDRSPPGRLTRGARRAVATSRRSGYRGRVSARHRAGLIAVAALALAGALAPSTAATAATVTCPASASSSAGPVQWLFSEYGAPTAASWVRGAGVWNSARSIGTICTEDKGGGLPTRHLVLAVSGNSALSPNITKLGLKGVGIVLPLTVSATDDKACPKGTRGSVTLFASYFGLHRDSIVVHFAPACASHNRTFTGSIVHVEIARNGHEVLTAAA